MATTFNRLRPAAYSDKSRTIKQEAYETILDLKEVLTAYRDPSRARHIYRGAICQVDADGKDHRCVWCKKADQLLGLGGL